MIVISEDVWGVQFEELGTRHNTHYDPNLWSRKEELITALNRAEALVVRNRTKVTRELIAHSPQLKVIARAGVGLDNIDIQAADDAGIVVVAGLGANATSVGELTLGLAIALLRNVTELNASTHAGSWNRKAGRELSGSTWGMLGCGATARATASLLKGFHCTVLAYDPFMDPNDSRIKDLGIELTDLDSVLVGSDVLSIHLPSNNETNGLINSQKISLMKKSAIIVNVGRGEVINESDLLTALKSGTISGAALDVRAEEPPHVGELETLPQVILAPHIAGITKESQDRIFDILTSNIELVLSSKPATHAVGTHKVSSR